MNKILSLLFVLLLGFVVFNRHRIYVRDPLASVYRNDVQQDGVGVYINISADVLVWKEDGADAFEVLVQHWNMSPGAPKQITCLQSIVCMTDSAHATTDPIFMQAKGLITPPVTMAGREVTFTAADSSTLRVELH